MISSGMNFNSRTLNLSRGSLLVLPVLLALAMLVLGLILTNARSATFSLDNFFINANWRHGLTARHLPSSTHGRPSSARRRRKISFFRLQCEDTRTCYTIPC
jgi:hypothetical protein